MPALTGRSERLLRFELTPAPTTPTLGAPRVHQGQRPHFFAVADFGSASWACPSRVASAEHLAAGLGRRCWSPIGGDRLAWRRLPLLRQGRHRRRHARRSPVTRRPSPPGAHITLGVKEPQVMATRPATTSPAPLLGGARRLLQRGSSWKLEDRGFPNVTVEYNIQQPVLFYASTTPPSRWTSGGASEASSDRGSYIRSHDRAGLWCILLPTTRRPRSPACWILRFGGVRRSSTRSTSACSTCPTQHRAALAKTALLHLRTPAAGR